MVRVTAAIVLAVLAVLAGCGGSTGRASEGGSGGPVILTAPAGTDAATIETAAGVVRERLTRMKVGVTSVTARADGVAVDSLADPYQLQAVSRRGATTIATVASSALGPCAGAGNDGGGPAARCYTLGPTVGGVGAVTEAEAGSGSGTGWKVTFSISSDQYPTFRRGLGAAGSAPLALVSDGVVVLTFSSGVPALRSVLGPGLTEEQARQAAAALVVDSTLPIALGAPPLPSPQGARVDLDFWTAALGVRVCGAWLANAPPSGLDTGVHSHGDGLVYVHPFTRDEAGTRATLGLFLERGLWKATDDRLQLWDGVTHRNGDACPNGSRGQVRWWVDGVERQGNPSEFLPRDDQVIVLGFDSDPAFPGPPPQMSGLQPPALGAATS